MKKNINHPAINKNVLKKLNNQIGKAVKIKAEVVGFVSIVLLFLSVFIGTLSAVTYKYIFLFWLLIEALLAYIGGLIAGYSYFSMYNLKFKK